MLVREDSREAQAFQSDKGDCLLLTAPTARGSWSTAACRASYTQHVAPALGELRGRKRLDLVYSRTSTRTTSAASSQLLD